MAKKAIKKPKAIPSTKKSVKEKVKPASKKKNTKEIKSEKPNTKIELIQEV